MREISRAEDGSLASRLIVAGGGGGAGLSQGCEPTLTEIPGGAGGDAGFDGGDGGSCGPVAGGTGGEAGTQSAGGAGGSPHGQSGSLGLGGNAASLQGSGGGGGYYGGGSGGEPRGEIINDVIYDAPGGGGGGGSSLDPDGGPTPTITSANPSITISYTVPGDNTAPTVTATSPLQPKNSDNLTATFSEPVTNVSPQTFILERNIAVKKAPPKYVLVDATVTPSADGLTAVLNPVQDLPKGDYRATITTDVTDVADNKLDQDQDPTNGNQPKVWTFRVAK